MTCAIDLILIAHKWRKTVCAVVKKCLPMGSIAQRPLLDHMGIAHFKRNGARKGPIPTCTGRLSNISAAWERRAAGNSKSTGAYTDKTDDDFDWQCRIRRGLQSSDEGLLRIERQRGK
jgi:hypothetical protein